MSRINWIQVLVFGLVTLVAFIIGLSLLPMFFGGGYWRMGRGRMPALSPVERMGGWCPWCGGTGRFGGGGLGGGLFGLLFMLPAMLIPIGLLVLLILGGVWLVRNMGGTGSAPPTPARKCPACDRPIEPQWRHCPYCGEELQ